MISFFVSGDPKTAGSKRGIPIPNKQKPGKMRVIIIDQTGQKGKDWRSDVRAAAKEVLPEDHALYDGALMLEVTFYKLRPKNHYRSGKNSDLLRADAPKYPHKWKDTTKMLRALEDALNKVVWTDDARIVKQMAGKSYGDRPGARVRIFELDNVLPVEVE